jgi:8-oxo-dGTP diphosphatase
MYCYKYPRPALTTDVIAFAYNQKNNDLELLLIRRKNPPFQGMLAFPGGFVEMDETAEACATRELSEETGLHGIPIVQLHTFSDVNRDPRGRTISIVYLSILKDNNIAVKGNDDASSANWYPLSQINHNLAFDHEQILNFALKFLLAHISHKCYQNYFSPLYPLAPTISTIGHNNLVKILEKYVQF